MGGSKGAGSAGNIAGLQAQLAHQLFAETDPLRKSLINRSQQYLTKGIDNSPTFSAFKAGAEPQFARAREQIIANTPKGGGLTSALAGLETGRASTFAQARGGIDEAELARAMGLGTGQTGIAVGGLGQASANMANITNAAYQREAAIYGAIGEALGGWAGGK